MRYSPEQKNKSKLYSVLFALAIFGVLFYSVPTVTSAAGLLLPPFPFTFTAVILWCAFIFIFIRYCMISFQYIIRPRSDIPENGLETVYAGDDGAECDITRVDPKYLDLVVIKAQGSRPGGMECVMGLDDLVRVIPISRRGENTKESVRKRYAADGFIFYDYTITFMRNEALELIFIDGNHYTGIILEPDERMTEYFHSIISMKGDNDDE